MVTSKKRIRKNIMKEYIKNYLLFKGNKYERCTGVVVWANIFAIVLAICALYLRIKELQNT